MLQQESVGPVFALLLAQSLSLHKSLRNIIGSMAYIVSITAWLVVSVGCWAVYRLYQSLICSEKLTAAAGTAADEKGQTEPKCKAVKTNQ